STCHVRAGAAKAISKCAFETSMPMKFSAGSVIRLLGPVLADAVSQDQTTVRAGKGRPWRSVFRDGLADLMTFDLPCLFHYTNDTHFPPRSLRTRRCELRRFLEFDGCAETGVHARIWLVHIQRYGDARHAALRRRKESHFADVRGERLAAERVHIEYCLLSEF